MVAPSSCKPGRIPQERDGLLCVSIGSLVLIATKRLTSELANIFNQDAALLIDASIEIADHVKHDIMRLFPHEGRGSLLKMVSTARALPLRRRPTFEKGSATILRWRFQSSPSTVKR